MRNISLAVVVLAAGCYGPNIKNMGADPLQVARISQLLDQK